MKVKPYLSLARVGIIESLQFRIATYVTLIGNLVYLVIVYFLWKAIFASVGTNEVNGMTFSDTIIYLVLATALNGFMEMYIVWEIGKNIQSGKIILDLLRPMKYRTFLFWSFSGNFVTHFFLRFLPTFVIVCVVTHGTVPLKCNLIYFIISVIIAISINYSIDFITGTICLYTESVWGINIMRQVIVLLLSGATVPLAFFPEPLKTIAKCLPFQSIYNAPLIILLDGTPQMKTLIPVLGMQLFWCLIMTILSKLFWKISIRKITVNGG